MGATAPEPVAGAGARPDPTAFAGPAVSADSPEVIGRRAAAVPGRRSQQFLWLWPVAVLLLMVVSGGWWGSLGTFVAAVVGTCASVLFVGQEVLQPSHRLAVTTLSVLLVAGALLAHQYNLLDTLAPAGRARPSVAKPSKTLDLRGKRVTPRDLNGRSLHGALLAGAVLDGLDLHNMDLSAVQARGASLRGTILDRANLQNADLRGVDFHGAYLYCADLRGAKLSGAELGEADVSNVRTDRNALRTAFGRPKVAATRASGTCERSG
ncbi:pentapeptide repeat-containing protein [Sphaerisporangium dianthi]|uniref:Pentapeptide repeat-containing protein n=1 Tax=Sphaerisporangium dianthi TaxID=1436120 RepID=A0ABV9CPE4_9ACTN